MLSAVFDSTVLVSAFVAKKGVSAQLLDQAVKGAFDFSLSHGIIEETRDVLLHRRHLRKRFTYTDQEVEEYAALLRAFARIVTDLPPVEVSRDPNDDPVIACAMSAGVPYLVTRDKDLLTLKSYQGVTMIRPEEFMHVIRQQPPPRGKPLN